MARTVSSYLLSSLDGVLKDPNEFVFDRFDEEMLARLKQIIEPQDAVLLGRVTYELWQPHWPSSTHEPFASFINNTPKYVASTTLGDVDWSNTTLIEGDVSHAVAQLKERPGGEIGVHGSVSLVRHLIDEGLLDELKLAVFPVFAGKGLRLYDGADGMRRMDLVDVDRTGAGVLILTYRPRPR